MTRKQPIAAQAADAGEQAKQAVREASPWIEGFGRFGFAAKGLVYGLIGVLAIRTAIGVGGELTGSEGALRAIMWAPFGRILLTATGIGLIGYALWLLVQALVDTENKGSTAKGIAIRAIYGFIALIHGGLAISAFAIALGSGVSESEWPGLTARLLSRFFGQWLVALVGAAVIGVGLGQIWYGYTAKFCDKLRLSEMSDSEESWATWLGRAGYIARGIVFGLVGTFLIAAAIQAEPQRARGLGGALESLMWQPWGAWVLGLVAVGLIAYGALMLFMARYRRMVIT